jgi:hypothetical protein
MMMVVRKSEASDVVHKVRLSMSQGVMGMVRHHFNSAGDIASCNRARCSRRQ